MDDRIHKWLFDIQNAILEVESFFENRKMDFFEYQNNVLLKRAVERELEIIGEAVNRIVKAEPSIEVKIADSRKIVGLRNQVIHAYDSISDEMIWAVVVHHLPKLKAEVEDLINN